MGEVYPNTIAVCAGAPVAGGRGTRVPPPKVYPNNSFRSQDKVDDMIAHLASSAEKRLIISFAPKTLALAVLKRIGELFPGSAKVRHIYISGVCLHFGVCVTMCSVWKYRK